VSKQLTRTLFVGRPVQPQKGLFLLLCSFCKIYLLLLDTFISLDVVIIDVVVIDYINVDVVVNVIILDVVYIVYVYVDVVVDVIIFDVVVIVMLILSSLML
jgi:hypothetical protein